jgi:hypothetical protein
MAVLILAVMNREFRANKHLWVQSDDGFRGRLREDLIEICTKCPDHYVREQLGYCLGLIGTIEYPAGLWDSFFHDIFESLDKDAATVATALVELKAVMALNQNSELKAISENKRLFREILREVAKAAVTFLTGDETPGPIRLAVLELMAEALPFLEGELRKLPVEPLGLMQSMSANLRRRGEDMEFDLMIAERIYRLVPQSLRFTYAMECRAVMRDDFKVALADVREVRGFEGFSIRFCTEVAAVEAAVAKANRDAALARDGSRVAFKRFVSAEFPRLWEAVIPLLLERRFDDDDPPIELDLITAAWEAEPEIVYPEVADFFSRTMRSSDMRHRYAALGAICAVGENSGAITKILNEFSRVLEMLESGFSGMNGLRAKAIALVSQIIPNFVGTPWKSAQSALWKSVATIADACRKQADADETEAVFALIESSIAALDSFDAIPEEYRFLRDFLLESPDPLALRVLPALIARADPTEAGIIFEDIAGRLAAVEPAMVTGICNVMVAAIERAGPVIKDRFPDLCLQILSLIRKVDESDLIFVLSYIYEDLPFGQVDRMNPLFEMLFECLESGNPQLVCQAAELFVDLYVHRDQDLREAHGDRLVGILHKILESEETLPDVLPVVVNSIADIVVAAAGLQDILERFIPALGKLVCRPGQKDTELVVAFARGYAAACQAEVPSDIAQTAAFLDPAFETIKLIKKLQITEPTPIGFACCTLAVLAAMLGGHIGMRLRHPAVKFVVEKGIEADDGRVTSRARYLRSLLT